MAAGRPVVKGVVSGPGGDLVFTLIPVKEIPPRIKEITFKLITVRPAQEFVGLGRRLEWQLTFMAMHDLFDERDLMAYLHEERMSYYDMLDLSP